MKAIVVGAGFAGLACARALEREGASVLVLEARERVGGRVWSTTMPDGTVVERGGEFLFPGYQVVPELAAELGLRLIEHGFVYGDRQPIGDGLPDRGQVVAAGARLAEHGARLRADGQRGSVEDVLAGAELSEGERRVLRARLTISLACELDVVSATWPAPPTGADGHSEFTMSSRVSGGNQRIADGIAAELRGELRLRTVVVAVERDAQGVIVRSADGGAERGDAAVVAVPAPLVRRIRFSPPLPAATEDAYARVPMGVVSKLQVALDERMEPEAIQEVQAPFWAYTAVQDDGRSGVVASAAGGFGAQRALDVASGPGVWRERLGRTWPGLRLGDDGALLTCWGLDPWSRGSYTHRPVDWSDAAEAALRAPAGRVLFAGEHTADEQSIEGALLSGRRAAGEALRR